MQVKRDRFGDNFIELMKYIQGKIFGNLGSIQFINSSRLKAGDFL